MTATRELSVGDYSQMKLPELADRIWTEADKAHSAMTSAAEHAIACGSMLQAAKDKVPHGSWMKWLKDNTQLSQSTANTYMRVAEANSQRAVNLESIRGTLKLLAQDKLEARSDFSEDYVPHDGEELPPLTPEAAPAFKAKPTAPVVVEAEVVEPEPADVNEPAPLIVDGTKHRPAPAPPASHIPEQEPVVADGPKEDGKTEKQPRLSKFIPDDAGRLWRLARTDLDKILKSDRSRERVLREVIEYGQTRLGPKRPVAEVETITAMLPHLTKDELAKLKRAIAVQWETLTGKAIEP
jgi:hypothetical protein